MKLPEVPGEEPEEPEGPTPQVALSYGEEEPLDEYNFVELINDSDTATSTDGLTVEILNPDGGVVTFAVPGNLSLPAGGFIVFYQLADDAGADGSETIVVRERKSGV